MKRQTILGALAALALAIVPFIAVTPASATVIPGPCTILKPTGTSYPDRQYSQQCSGTLSDATAMHDAVPNQSWNELARAGVIYYYFATAQDYLDSAVGLGLGSPEPVTDNAGGVTVPRFSVTHFGTDNQPIYTAVFKQNGATTILQADIKYNTTYEVGRAMDHLIGYVMNGGIGTPTLTTVSASAGTNQYVTNFNHDWSVLNAKVPCGLTGVFSGRLDASGAYICTSDVNGQGKGQNLAAPYFSLPSCGSAPVSPCNQNVLKRVWPLSFASADRILAEQYQGGSRPTISAYMPNFACSNVIQREAGEGHIATAADFSGTTGCSVPTLTTKCSKLWLGAPQVVERIYPDGNVFDCTGNTAVAGAIQTGLSKLGSFGSPPSYTFLRRGLTSARANVYVFATSAAYVSAFTAAGQPQVGNFDPSSNAATYPNSTMWYSIISENGPNHFGTQLNPQVEVASHESGHVIDFNAGQPSAAPSFLLAMQNDWLSLDYANKNQSTPRNPCGSVAVNGYKGPLVGLLDPSTGLQFCTGTVVEAKWRTPVVKKVHEILQDPTVSGPVNLHLLPGGHLGFNPGYTSSNGWIEWFPIAFQYIASYDNQGAGYGDLLKSVIENGYFGCTAGDGVHNPIQGFVLWIYAGQTVNLPATCTQTLPGWWTPPVT